MSTAEALPCGACLKRPPAFDQVVVPWAYCFPLDRLIHRYKFDQCLYLGPMLAGLWREGAGAFERPEWIVPVPAHRRRLRQRGFDQAGDIARCLSHQLALPLKHGLLRRLRATPPQAGLAAKQRRANLHRAFSVETGPIVDHVALVDDVMTTGSTAQVCAAALKRAGVRRVDVWAVARA